MGEGEKEVRKKFFCLVHNNLRHDFRFMLLCVLRQPI